METTDIAQWAINVDMGNSNKRSNMGQKVKSLIVKGKGKVRFWINNIPRWWKRKCERKRANDPKKVIRLAVVGVKSSGKSFFLRDIIDALRSNGGAYYPLSRTEFQYQDFSHYERNQKQTDPYACRQENHFGQTVVMDRKEFDFDFLNIPGEIFKTKQDIQKYIDLRSALDVKSKLFTVTTYKNETSDEEILFVEARTGTSITNNDRGYVLPDNWTLSTERFLEWKEIFGSLTAKGFTPLTGSRRDISGKTLLENFFEYQTDSVIQSISDLLKTHRINIQGLDSTDFKEGQHGKAFVFFQYCTLATDIVICDRIFAKVKDEQQDMDFGELVDQLSTFLNRRESKPNVYLALRNVDFLLKQKEVAYKTLHSEILKGMAYEKKRNIIYSLFYYAIHHYLYGYPVWDKDFNYKIGLPDQFRGIDKNIQAIIATYLDTTANGGIVHNAENNLKNHITSRIGGQGRAFQQILNQAGWVQHPDATSLVPHVYFTCTPITEDYDIYENETDDGFESNEFYRDKDKNKKFSERNSCACFGSFQLLMDILVQHGIFDNPPMGQLLRELQAKNKK